MWSKTMTIFNDNVVAYQNNAFKIINKDNNVNNHEIEEIINQAWQHSASIMTA